VDKTPPPNSADIHGCDSNDHTVILWATMFGWSGFLCASANRWKTKDVGSKTHKKSISHCAA